MRALKSFAVTAMAACALAAGSALAQTPAPAAPPASTQPPGATLPSSAPASPGGLSARPITPPTHHRKTLAQRFDAANTTHDGHLTLAQAKAANMNGVVKNYDQMDVAKKGYVTMDDIHAFNRSRHRARASKAPPKLEAQ